MGMTQRAIRSVARKPLKNLLLFFIFFMISSFLMAAFACGDAGVAIQNQAKQAISGTFQLEINDGDLNKRFEDVEPIQMPNGSFLMKEPNNQFVSLLLEDVEQIASVEGIKNYNLTTKTTPVNLVDFKRIEDEKKDQSSDFGGVNLYGNRDMSYDFNITHGNIKLKEGRLVEPGDQNKIVISEELAKANNITLGDTLSFNADIKFREEQDLTVNEGEIIGIFTIINDIPSTMDGDTFRSENTIFCDLHFPEKVENHEGDPMFPSAVFEVEDADKYEEVKKDILDVDIGWQRYNLIDNNGMYEEMSENFNGMGDISQLFALIVAGAGLCIIIFVLLLWIRNRNHEIGVFMSMGIKKTSITMQLFLEVFLISALAFAASFCVSPMLSNKAAAYIAKEQKKEMVQKELEMKDEIGHSGTIEEGENEMVGVSIQITPAMAVNTGGWMLSLNIGAVMIASISIMRKSTVEILSNL